MAVYTDVTVEELEKFLAGYDLGELRSYKGMWTKPHSTCRLATHCASAASSAVWVTTRDFACGSPHFKVRELGLDQRSESFDIAFWFGCQLRPPWCLFL